MNDKIIDKLLNCAERGAEIHFVNIAIPPTDSGTSHKSRTPEKKRRGRKKSRRGRN